jgi:DNA-binding MarR family transcriptional regulator
MKANPVAAIQRHYPQIYLACHAEHVRRRSTPAGLSAHDSSVLAHLDATQGISASVLARHLGITASTLSATITRLNRLGYIEVVVDAKDRRVRHLTLTPDGQKAMERTSVLDARRVRDLLGELGDREKTKAIAGLELLAKAARQLRLRQLKGKAKP